MTDQFNWKSFTYSVNSKAIVPVLGNDLSNLRLKKSSIEKLEYYNAMLSAGEQVGDTLEINLYKYLAFRIWENLSSKPLDFDATINNVARGLMAQNITESDIQLAIKNEINALTNEQIILDPFIKLISIGGFETFVSLNYDNFLERAFEAAGRLVNKSYNFSNPFSASVASEKKDPALPKIYNLMGNIQGANFAITDDQSIEFLYMLQNGMDTIAKELFDAISQKSMLFIGSSLPDWFMRIFIRILSKEPFRSQVKKKYVAANNILKDTELKKFLESNNIKVIPIGQNLQPDTQNKFYKNAIDFIEDVHNQVSKVSGPPPNEVLFKEEIFISYSWTDKSLAERMKNELMRNGVNVFFDDDELKTGEKYNDVIIEKLKTCAYFLVIISENAIADKSRYVYAKEWTTAILYEKLTSKSYIRPFIIDATKPTDPRIPDEIRLLNIESITNLDELPKTIRKFISENNLTPLK
ncbi:MAG: toll/interleukin-1 receptor domain-containing protein [Bacteroidetes bacterium]|nr:toll/interleukin-1 receptor domain-containing protein [Bacteroidota bacterium]